MRPALFITLAAVLLLPIAGSAQSLETLGAAQTTFTISTAPNYPMPHGNVTLSFLSAMLDLANATLSVMANGKNIYSGSVRPVSVTLGNTGSITAISATITSAGTDYSQLLSLQPEEVSIVAEPIASAPPLYPGKPSVPLEGDVRVVAVANFRTAGGKALDPAALSYTWTVDDARITNASGIGKAALIVASPLQYRTRTVSVAVQNQDETLVGGASITFSPREPRMRVYENDPLLGIRFDRALSGAFSITGSESTLFAAPFSLPTTGGAPLVRWFLNGDAVQTGNSITLRPSGTGQGSAALSLTASTGQYASASTDLSLIFGTKPSSNFFGL